ncbi:hypothetical protein FA13DRAFT_1788662 [Coprinellus micaceus]|uniref:Glycosyltransferase family 31 protein n=1 Tax=Coprinellus micaceus TaxID=71717 RepID=A0A4Y7TLK6_COPMI|nr:hypothetical protein FA13DRAFT_1788662 [Coprinellus micaceus]
MDSDYSSDSEDTVRVDDYGVASSSATPTNHLFLIPQRVNSGRASVSSSVSSTPIPSRAGLAPPPLLRPSPAPPFRIVSSVRRRQRHRPLAPYPPGLLFLVTLSMDPREPAQRKLVVDDAEAAAGARLPPLADAQEMGTAAAIFITLLLIYLLNPDKEPLPWRAYCSIPSLVQPVERPFPGARYSIYPDLEPGQMIPSFPPSNLDELPPAGLFIGVFSIDSAFERRMLVRTTWASHPRSRDGAIGGDEGRGTSRTVVRFILGLPRKDWERRVKLEMEMYNDIVILPIPENMNSGKTHSFFSWASLNAWVPPLLAPHDPFAAWENIQSGQVRSWVRPDFVVKVDDDSFVMLAEMESRLRVELHSKPKPQHNSTLVYRRTGPATSSPLASPSSSTSLSTSTSTTEAALPSSSGADNSTPTERGDEEDDEEEERDVSTTSPSTSTSATRSKSSTSSTSSSAALPSNPPLPSYPESLTDNDPLIYWGYLVTNRLHQFMAGEVYSLSWSLVDWVAKDATVKTMTKGAEDKQTAKWMRAHPRAEKVRWTSERCWIYDHPRSSTVYSHGFLFPSEITRIKHAMSAYIERWTTTAALGSSGHSNLNAPSSSIPATPAAWSHSSVSTFGVRYTPPLPSLSTRHSVEALVEGSEMSILQEGSPVSPERAWVQREGRNTRYENKRVGGTVVVHFIKKNMWYLETALALLEGEELSEVEMMIANEEMGVGSKGKVDGSQMEAEEAYWKNWAHNNFRQKRLGVPSLQA